MLDERSNSDIKISTAIVKNWARLADIPTNTKEKRYADLAERKLLLCETVKKGLPIEGKKLSLSTDDLELNQDYKVSHAHCLHQSFEAFGQGLHSKIDIPQQSPFDLSQIDSFATKFFEQFEKLGKEVRELGTLIQETEKKRLILELKMDELLKQNEVLTKKVLQCEFLSERFFSQTLKTVNVSVSETISLALDENIFPLNKENNVNSIIEKTTEAEYFVKNESTKQKINEQIVSFEETNKQVNNHSDNNFLVSIEENTNPPNFIFETNKLSEKTDTTDNYDCYNLEELKLIKRRIEKYMRKRHPEDYKKLKKHERVDLFSSLKSFIQSLA